MVVELHLLVACKAIKMTMGADKAVSFFKRRKKSCDFGSGIRKDMVCVF